MSRKGKTMETDPDLTKVGIGRLAKSECPCCEVNFVKLEESIWRHLDSKHGVSIYEFLCYKCGLRFHSAAAREGHFQTAHLSPKASYRCIFCKNKEFHSDSEMKNHQDSIHKDKGNYHECQICGKYHMSFSRYEECIITHINAEKRKKMVRVKNSGLKLKNGKTPAGESGKLPPNEGDDDDPMSNSGQEVICTDDTEMEKVILPVSVSVELNESKRMISWQLNFELNADNCTYITKPEGRIPDHWVLKTPNK